MILDGKQVASEIKIALKTYFSDSFWQNKYVAIFLLSDDKPSKVYVGLKKKFGQDIGLNVEIITDYDGLDDVLDKINQLNRDINCIGIVVQLPLPDDLKSYKSQILSTISPQKDLDGLGGLLVGLSGIGLIDFMPATPMAVIKLLQYYNLADFNGKKIAVLGQSNLVGKPLAMEMIKRGAEVFSFNSLIDISEVCKITKMSDYIISATGALNLIDERFVRNDKTQILVDVGWGMIGAKPCGDVNYMKIKDMVYAISPVPGGVGPLTVACLFENIKVIHEEKILNHIFKK